MKRGHWYRAAGASLIAAALTARYVARWRRGRGQRHGEHDPLLGRAYIGLDLSDPYAASPRPCDVAMLSQGLECSFTTWDFQEDGTGIIPEAAIGRSFILAIDGPQGLAGADGAVSRESERLVAAPGRTGYRLPEPGKPYNGLIMGSVRLFQNLVALSPRFRLIGMEGIDDAVANLLEAFPGGAWRVAGGVGLPAKRTLEGRRARLDLVRQLDIRLPAEPELPSADQFDALMAAWTAWCFGNGLASKKGLPPTRDPETGIIREGYVVLPAPELADDGRTPRGVVAPV
ncbi:MAG: DUF429 domain-containing protein [SAR202 cluster bacterium]|nr:DUF429 domain-containing protein [SAR202 cluster bacterium]